MTRVEGPSQGGVCEPGRGADTFLYRRRQTVDMTFLFLGIDGLDHQLCRRFGTFDDVDAPIQIRELDQDLPEAVSQRGDARNNDGHWTFYVWGAIASGQVETPEIRQTHPLRDEVEYPLKWRYIRYAPRSLLRYLEGRLPLGWTDRIRDAAPDRLWRLLPDRLTGFVDGLGPRRPRYGSFAWDDFDTVKVINYPIHLPEYCRNCNLVRDDAISRDYGPQEPQLLAAEINDALQKGYDAVFAVTRFVDCICHGATHPDNYGADDMDDWMRQSGGVSFDELHGMGADVDEPWKRIEDLDVPAERQEAKREITEQVFGHVEDTYESAAELVENVRWWDVDEHVLVSDHGFDKLGAGDVNAHGRSAVLSCSFGYWPTMTRFVEGWREALHRKLWEDPSGSGGEAVEASEEERVKERLADLGYNL